MGLFSDLESLGFDKVNMDEVFDDEKKSGNVRVEVNMEGGKKEKTEAEVLFDKTHKCVLCDYEFKTKAVRDKSVKMIDQDEDLRPIYEFGIDPLKYDAIICPKCGYAALNRYFTPLTNFQIKTLKAEYCPNFKGIRPEPGPEMSYEGAILRHKLSLMCALKRNGKQSEKAYIFLKMAWLFRASLQHQADKLTPEQKKEMAAQELECIEKAYEGFSIAFTKEPFPMCGMDEISLRYIMAALAFRLGKNREAAQYLAGVLQNRQASDRVKYRALELKDKIKKAVEEEAAH